MLQIITDGRSTHELDINDPEVREWAMQRMVRLIIDGDDIGVLMREFNNVPYRYISHWRSTSQLNTERPRHTLIYTGEMARFLVLNWPYKL